MTIWYTSNMNSIPHADLFFFVATIGFVIIFVLFAIALGYLISLFKSILKITKIIEKDIETIGDTTKEFIMQLWDNQIFSWLFGAKKKKKKSLE
jgi:MFS superfamily sulfate permease-like transporter